NVLGGVIAAHSALVNRTAPWKPGCSELMRVLVLVSMTWIALFVRSARTYTPATGSTNPMSKDMVETEVMVSVCLKASSAIPGVVSSHGTAMPARHAASLSLLHIFQPP